MKNKKRIIIIGGGLSGLSAALYLAVKGYQVMILEKNKYVGGQLRRIRKKGFTFHLGANVLTMNETLSNLFACADKKMEDYLTLVQLEPQWRMFFPDGITIDLTSDFPKSLDQETHQFLSENLFEQYLDLCRHSHQLMLKNVQSQFFSSFLFQHFKQFFDRNYKKNIQETNNQFLEEPHMKQIFDSFSMLESLPADQASPLLLYLVYNQLHFGLYYIKDGFYRLIEALVQILYELGVEIRTEAEVCKILTECFEVVGIELADGTQLPADIILSSVDPKSTYKRLLRDFSQTPKVIKRFDNDEPLLSGHFLLLGVKKAYKELIHHNYFFTKKPEQERHFLFDKKKPAPDPSVYVGVSSFTDPHHAPDGKQNLIIFSHVPALKEGENWDQYRKPFYASYRLKVLSKLEKMGLHHLERNIEWEMEVTPKELKEYLGSAGGSIYGIGPPKKLTNHPFHSYKANKINFLYFIGSSVSYGNHIPMILLSSKKVSEQIVKDIQTYS